MFEVILWDVDGTLLNFKAAEKAAIKALFLEKFHRECSDESIEIYSKINKECWGKIERGEIEKSRALLERFERFFIYEGIDGEYAKEFNDEYQLRLGDTVVFNDESDKIVDFLRGKIKQCVVSNGTVVAQTKKLEKSGLGAKMDGVFLSEQVGAEKPNIEFFNAVFKETGDVDKDKVLIVGDSAASDIQGGKNAGIRTCLYDPHGAYDGEIVADYTVKNLKEVLEILF